MVQEADDFYFPPVTGSYLRITRFIILILTFFLTPTFMLLMQNPEWIPEPLKFITIQETINVPIILQFLILELSIDGLRLAAVNTPSMLTTPLSVTAGLVLGEFSVKSGWFNSEVMLYMAFVAIANYTHPSYELGYAIKFFRIITLILTAVFNLWGFILGVLLFIIAIATNKMISGQSYLYPLIPFSFKKLGNALVRKRLPNSKE
jgi:stage V sporulation protein AF